MAPFQDDKLLAKFQVIEEKSSMRTKEANQRSQASMNSTYAKIPAK